MNRKTTIKGLDVTHYIDLIGEPVFYNEKVYGIIEDQTFDGRKTDFVIRWDSVEIAEMMKDKWTTVDANVVFVVKVLDEEEAKA